MKEKRKSKAGRNPKLDPAVYRYTVRFNEEEHNRFLAMFGKSGVYARSVFLKAHFFGQPFKVLKVDKTLVDYYTKLSDFHAQFRAVGTNYNQVVKELRLHFSEKKAMALLYKLEAGEKDKGKQVAANLLAMKDLQILKWQRLSYMSIVAMIICIFGIIFIATRSTFIPYVIHVDPETGYVKSLGALEQGKTKVTSTEVNYFLSQFVTNMRSIPKDEYVLKENVDKGIKYLTSQSAQKYKNLYLDEFTKKIGSEYSRIRILNVNPIANTKNTYQVRWEETTINKSNSMQPIKTVYTGNFSIEQKTVSNKEDLVLNPLGLYITDFEFSQEGVGGK